MADLKALLAEVLEAHFLRAMAYTPMARGGTGLGSTGRVAADS